MDQPNQYPSQFILNNKWLMVGVPVLLSLLLTWLFYANTRSNEAAVIYQEFINDAVSMGLTLEENINIHIGEVYNLRSLFISFPEVTREQFESFTAYPINQHAGVQAFEWIPRVPESQRIAFEQDARKDGFSEFQFKQWTEEGWVVNPDGWAEDYFPVYYVEPFAGNEAAFGIDLASNDTRLAALEEARDINRPVATARITLAQEEGQQAGFLIFIPVYEPGFPLETIDQRRTHHQGFVLGVFQVGDMIDKVLAGLEREEIRLRLVDVTDSSEGEILYDELEGDLSLSQGDYSFDHQIKYEIGEREWQMQFIATDRYLATRNQNSSAIVLIGGLLLSFLVGTLIWFATSQTETVENLVVQRTRELVETNNALHEATQQLQKSGQLLLQNNEELKQFAYITSHDLQEPLRTLTSYSDLLKVEYGKTLEGDGEIYLNFILQAAERMRNLIKVLLDYSRLGKDSEIETVDCNALISEIQDDLQLTITEAGAALTVEPLPIIQGYATELRLLFQNLISNGIRFRHAERPSSIHLSAVEHKGEWEFSVRDNGIGIAPEHTKKIFEIFQRLHRRNEIEGTGIGLAHCQKIVTLHKGEIWVESIPDLGSVFKFTIPKKIQ